MNISSIGYNSIYGSGSRIVCEPERGRYLLLLSRSGIRLKTGEKYISMPEDTLIIYDDCTTWDYAADGGVLVCDWVCFEPSGDSELLEAGEIALNTPLRFLDTELVSLLIRSMEEEFYSVSSRRAKLLEQMMKIILAKAGECRSSREPQQTADPHYSAMMELRERIYRNPQMKWNVDALAAAVNMSRSYFQHVYRDMFGVSCMSDVINGKIEKAKEILSETSCTVSQVAAMCGYDNEEHFMRQFKKIVGVTPTRYRKK
ncbi:MAG: helix-turn-helix transcriptional regulator [Ruminococcus sp.]|nr:helix-turn-helix transcriptional regulator [Ruminococcus sp.]